jgi:hypothetical protein
MNHLNQYRVTLSWTVDIDASTEQEAIELAHEYWAEFGCEHDAASVEQVTEGEES